MSLYAAFLRGVNVGGHRLTNDELRAHFSAMGFREVGCFRASGNVVFAGEQQPVDTVRERIEQGLHQALGYAVPTYIRTAEQLLKIAASKPFASEHVQASSGKLQVALLAGEPPAKARRQVLALAGEQDRLLFGERELYWLPSGGVLESTLELKAIEGHLGAMTMRTKNTVEQIAGRYFAEQ
jgi:uncharacterized protein (DUF1697 family)